MKFYTLVIQDVVQPEDIGDLVTGGFVMFNRSKIITRGEQDNPSANG